MKTDLIDEVGIDEKGRLYVRPRASTFPFVYREGMAVQWNEDREFLFGPPPRRWDYIRWYRQIISAAEMQGVTLEPHPDTIWFNLPEGLRNEISQIKQNA